MKVAACFVGLAFAFSAMGCTVKADDSERFRDPIPQGSDVAVGVPGAGAGGSRTASADLHVLSDPAGASGAAQYYVFTRAITDVVDVGSAMILGSVWAVVHSPPTSLSAHAAVWGPSGDALSPVVWRFTVNEVGDHEYDYALEGRPKGSISDADYRVVLRGHGFGKERAEHRSGWFQGDADAFRALDPSRATDNGTTKITYDLRALPATLDAEIHHTDGSGDASIKVTHEAGGGGAVDIGALADVSTPKDGTLENVTLHSRWNGTGAGRADARFTSANAQLTVDATECWSSTFQRVYYEDSANTQPSTGAAASCAFPAAR